MTAEHQIVCNECGTVVAVSTLSASVARVVAHDRGSRRRHGLDLCALCLALGADGRPRAPRPDQSTQPTGADLREALGRLVREVWIEWAREQPDAKPSWLVGWDELPERDREVDRRIGETLHARGLGSVLAGRSTIDGLDAAAVVDAALNLGWATGHDEACSLSAHCSAHQPLAAAARTPLRVVLRHSLAEKAEARPNDASPDLSR